ncbi:hypothetical protein [Paenibacillus sp.]|uniref:hypothetical protein n=1 Tax=Paenibacillus sp. TaxID=58172 RepID=UPI002D5ACC98|nr:hypothetical protein [Paenibacillus sp.]HZG87963.1 hypothetical protein [Paenibacillus sp.]
MVIRTRVKQTIRRTFIPATAVFALFLLAVFLWNRYAYSGDAANGNASSPQKVTVYEMESFSSVDNDSLIAITDAEAIRTVRAAIGQAQKYPGIINVVDPEYKIEFGAETYYLWINENSGSLMNIKDTHTIYTLPASSAKTLQGVVSR